MAFVMEKIVEQGILLDFYGPLLTEHQQEICRAAVYEDLSLAEIAEQYGITRQGVHDLLKRCDHTLRGYEEKLGLTYQSIHEYIRFGTCGDAETDAKIRAKEAGSAHKRNKPPVIEPFPEA